MSNDQNKVAADPKVVQIKFSKSDRVKGYNGRDEAGGNANLNLKDGETALVTSKKADQLLADFPNNFKVVGTVPAEGVEAAKIKPASAAKTK